MQYLIPAILTFIFALLFWFLTNKRLSIDYEIIESAQFPREEGTGQYFIIRIRNSGNTKVEDINLTITFSTGSIESKSFTSPELFNLVTDSASEIQGIIPLLNPKETFSITITMIGKENILPPKVNARGRGITASLRSDTAISSYLYPIIATISVAAIFATASSLYTSFRTSKVTESIVTIGDVREISESLAKSGESFSETLQRQREEINKAQEESRKEFEQRIKYMEQRQKELDQELQESLQGKPQTEQIIFAIFNRAGLSHRFPDLVENADRIAFWKTGLFLMHLFLVDENNRDKYISAAKSLVELPNMAPSSRGFNLYLLGKMEQYRGNKAKAIVWFEKCKEKTPLMYEHLMTQDPAYDLEELRKYLQQQGGN